MDSEGTLTLEYTEDTVNEKGESITNKVVLDLGSITSISVSMNKAVSTIPLVSMGIDRTFQLETGNTLTYTISFKRVMPDVPDDVSDNPLNWSNAKWYYALNKAVDRWQMKSDGFRLRYVPSSYNPYTPEIDVNGYIKVLTRKYSNSYNTVITGNLQFVVGTMYVLSGNTTISPQQKTYDKVTLKPYYYNESVTGVGISSDDKEIIDDMFKLTDVTYRIDGEYLITPDKPMNWTKYADSVGKRIEGWYYLNRYDSLYVANVGYKIMLSGIKDNILYAKWGDVNEE